MNPIQSSRRQWSSSIPNLPHSSANASARQRIGTTTTRLCLWWMVLSCLICPLLAQGDQDCNNNLYLSDADGDRRVDNDEYVTFVKLEGPEDFLPNVETFVQLPIMLQSNFYTLACLCRTQGGAADCCVGDNANLNAMGTAPDEMPSASQASYLNLVCGLTTQAIVLVVNEQTSSPTEFAVSDVPSTAPSQMPTSFAPVTSTPVTQAPTTEAPSIVATQTPTEAPSTVTPTTTAPPTGVFDPSMVLARTSYTILVPNGRIESVPISSYENDLIEAMDQVALDVAIELSQSLPATRGSDERQLRSLLKTKSFRRRLEEIIVMRPTQIVEVVNVGFTSDPQLIGGKFLRGPCPYDLGNPTTDLCQEVTASIELDLSTLDNNPQLVYGLYLAALDKAILAGDLGVALSDVSPDAPVDIASGQESEGGPPSTIVPTVAPTTGPPIAEKSKLSGGAIAGISAGAALLFIVGYCAFSSQQQHENMIQQKKEAAKKLRHKEAEKHGEDPEAHIPTRKGYESDDFDGDAGAAFRRHRSEQSLKGIRKKSQMNTGASTTVASTASISDSDGQPLPKQSHLGQQLVAEDEKRPEYEDIVVMAEDEFPSMLAVAVPYINSPNRDKDKVELQPRIEIEGSERVVPSGAQIPVEGRSIGTVSHESEAGWSEAYTSSIGSVADDELLPEDMDSTPPPGQQMVSILPDSPLAQGSPQGKEVTADDKMETLESAIIAGDWAAVGATAAALASMQDSRSRSESSRGSTNLSNVSSLRSQNWKDKIDNDKADELDQLIERGDWEGIILAAANFGAEATGTSNDYSLGQTNGQSSDDSNGALMVHEDGSDDEDGERYQESLKSSRRSSKSSAPGQTLTREEIRQEIRALVEEVVPEEVDHVDEMLEQFKGREQELIETLATMQERAEAMNSGNKKSGGSIFKGKL